MLVRTATASDATAIEDVLMASYAVMMAGAYSDDVLEAALPLMTKPNLKLIANGQFAVVASDDGLLACGGYSFERPGDGRAEPGLAHIRHYATLPSAVRRGFGRLLFEWCANAARREGATAFECYSALNAVSFYRAMGFEVVREDVVKIGGLVTFPMIVMRATI
ncbi:MAG: GNAT family N-acetyltransferase [Hyphomicrobiaceae bacterium]|nr:GNAT family N-acetyltransferase [Hyphomicrobiaceae bacterium]